VKRKLQNFAKASILALAAQIGVAATTYTYDSGGHLIQVNYGAAGVVSYSYDAAGNLIARQVKAIPALTWPAPAAITFGSALSASQLNATTTILGTFVYTPPAGTVLPVGANQTLSVTFTPNDTTDYASASATTTITVNPASAPGSPVNLVVTRLLTRTGGNVVAQLTVANTGGTAAASVTITSVKVGSDTATPLPQSLGAIAAEAAATATVTVPGSVGGSGTASSLTVSGTYTGGTFTSNARITLP
jgi:YD repeat-containing protein